MRWIDCLVIPHASVEPMNLFLFLKDLGEAEKVYTDAWKRIRG